MWFHQVTTHLTGYLYYLLPYDAMCHPSIEELFLNVCEKVAVMPVTILHLYAWVSLVRSRPYLDATLYNQCAIRNRPLGAFSDSNPVPIINN